MGIRRKFEDLMWGANLRIGFLIPISIRQFVYHRLLYPAGKHKARTMHIDVVGSCNLRCPSCPVGNMGQKNKSGIMDVDTFDQILAKAKSEFGVRAVFLFNWTEPLLHPRLAELVRAVKSRGMFCGISSNLNVMPRIDDILKEDPDDFRISLSGFSQAIYGQTHVSGNIERVKENMRVLSQAKRSLHNNHTRIHVYYHKYKHNLDEVAPMRALAKKLGFDWLEYWAYYMPLERVLEVAEGRIQEDQRAFIENQFALPIIKAVSSAEEFKHERCSLLEDQIIVDVQGNVNLCCAVYDGQPNRLGHFLDMNVSDMNRAKENHPTCTTCASHGLHTYFTYFEHPVLKAKFNALAESNVPQSSSPAK